MNAQLPDFPPSHSLPSLDPARMPRHAVDEATLEAQNIYGFLNGDTRSRPFKLLRSQVLRAMGRGGETLIGVTSATPGVGKSFVAANLAAALSRIAGTTVYLLDLDLQRPSIARRFSLTEGKAIHDYLSGETDDLAAVARRINDEQLVVLPGYPRRHATGELLSSGRADALFAALRALPQGAVVVVDMPPIFADDDAVILSSRLDGFLLVAEDGRTTAKQVKDTIQVMQPTPLIGTVLNRYRSQIFSDDYGYGAGYGYGQY